VTRITCGRTTERADDVTRIESAHDGNAATNSMTARATVGA
jgi:hypothetical protein